MLTGLGRSRIKMRSLLGCGLEECYSEKCKHSGLEGDSWLVGMLYDSVQNKACWVLGRIVGACTIAVVLLH